ncbi:MAG: DUF4926 domain-containing protein [Chloroflexota bacterium]|nr:DUF4926 domain-containing protein [Chloroflexota bacterium]
MEGINELDTIVLERDLPEFGLQRGDVGTIVHYYRDGAALEVEFVAGDGTTLAVLTLELDDVRPMRRREILHARELAA